MLDALQVRFFAMLDVVELRLPIIIGAGGDSLGAENFL